MSACEAPCGVFVSANSNGECKLNSLRACACSSCPRRCRQARWAIVLSPYKGRKQYSLAVAAADRAGISVGRPLPLQTGYHDRAASPTASNPQRRAHPQRRGASRPIWGSAGHCEGLRGAAHRDPVMWRDALPNAEQAAMERRSAGFLRGDRDVQPLRELQKGSADMRC